MPDTRTLGPWLRRFLEEHLTSERNLARNTQLSYRDTLALLLPFVAARVRRPVEQLAVRDLSAAHVRAFLAHLEEVRGCCPRTRNQRLAAIRALARYVADRSPAHVEWCGQIRAIPLKKAAQPAVGYLEKDELDALLEVPDTATPQGRRERALLLFMYHTGARVSEAVQLTVGDLQLAGRSAGARESGPRPGRGGAGVPQPARTPSDPLRHVPSGPAQRGGSGRASALHSPQKGQPAHLEAHGGDSHAARERGPSHHQRLAGPRQH